MFSWRKVEGLTARVSVNRNVGGDPTVDPVLASCIFEGLLFYVNTVDGLPSHSDVRM